MNGKIIVQRTAAGTQGIARRVKAQSMVSASFVVAGATIKYIERLSPIAITFVITGQTYDGGEEDLACAEYLEALLRGTSPDPAPFLERVLNSEDAKVFHDPQTPQFTEFDVVYCTGLDKFDFAMPVIKEHGRHVMRAIKP